MSENAIEATVLIVMILLATCPTWKSLYQIYKRKKRLRIRRRRLNLLREVKELNRHPSIDDNTTKGCLLRADEKRKMREYDSLMGC